jgi:hypothetical protein
MSALPANLFLFEDLDNADATRHLAQRDLKALRRAAHWIETFVARPNKALGRSGPVCPFVPGARERKTLWLAPERLAGRNVAEVVELMSKYEQLLLRTEPVAGKDTSYKALVIVFTDSSAERAKGLLDDVRMQNRKRLSYAEDGVVTGEFHASNEGSAIRNPSFHPFQSPVPFVLMRHGVVGDWMFFLDNEDWRHLWARRFGEAAVQSLADALRRTGWRSARDDIRT